MGGYQASVYIQLVLKGDVQDLIKQIGYQPDITDLHSNSSLFCCKKVRCVKLSLILCHSLNVLFKCILIVKAVDDLYCASVMLPMTVAVCTRTPF